MKYQFTEILLKSSIPINLATEEQIQIAIELSKRYKYLADAVLVFKRIFQIQSN